MNELEVVQGNGRSDLTLTDPGILQVAERAGKLVQALKIIRGAVLKLTNVKDWENLGGKPYLNEGGAKKVGAAFGVSWQLDTPMREDYADGHFDYIVKGRFMFRGSEQEETGTRSSKDDFFSKSKGQEVPPSEIDRNDVRKAAVTNCIARGVKSVLALKNFTWEEIEAAGVEQEKISKVAYAEKSDDPLAAPIITFGQCKGKAIDDPSIPLEQLKYYLNAVLKSINDPSRARFKKQNEDMRDALKAEIAKRDTQPKEEMSVDGFVPEEQWTRFVKYMDEDKVRSQVKDYAKEQWGVKSLADIEKTRRSQFIDEVIEIGRSNNVKIELPL